jgi:hypothetical protein
MLLVLRARNVTVSESFGLLDYSPAVHMALMFGIFPYFLKLDFLEIQREVSKSRSGPLLFPLIELVGVAGTL